MFVENEKENTNNLGGVAVYFNNFFIYLKRNKGKK